MATEFNVAEFIAAATDQLQKMKEMFSGFQRSVAVDPSLHEITRFVNDPVIREAQKSVLFKSVYAEAKEPFSEICQALANSSLESIKAMIHYGGDSTEEFSGRDDQFQKTTAAERFGHFTNVSLLPCSSEPTSPDAVLFFSIFSAIPNQARTPAEWMRLDQTFQVLSSQPISALARVIYCQRDFLHSDQAPSYPPLSIAFSTSRSHVAESRFTGSQTFLIGGKFFIDSYSQQGNFAEGILAWIEGCERRSARYWNIVDRVPALMQDVTFRDIPWKIGEQHVYAHHGSCFHYLTLTQVRLRSGVRREPDLSLYPLLVFQRRLKRRRCSICEMFPACRITVFDIHTPESISYICNSCYKHVSKQGSSNSTVLYMHDP